MERNTNIDYLRSFIAYLGIILHAAIITLITHFHHCSSVSKLSLSEVFLGFTGISIHTIRLGIFFIIAGYFTYHQLSTRSISAYLWNRLKRILLPLVIMFILFNADKFTVIAFYYLKHQRPPIEILNNLSYLWFLYYLLFYYLLISVCSLLKPIFNRANKIIDDTFVYLLKSPISPLIFAIFTLPSTLNLNIFNYTLYNGFIPEIGLFTYYFIFFIFGYLLFKTKCSLKAFRPYCFWHLTIGSCLLILVTKLLLPHLFDLLNYSNTSPSLLIKMLLNLSAWLIICATLGMFSFLNTPNKIIFTLANSSYWVYLSHFPILLITVPYIYQKAHSLTLTFIFSVSITTGIVLITYLSWRGFKNTINFLRI